MKTIGLIGGMSWESSAEYYRILNEEVNRRLGGVHSAKCVMVSVDFAEVEAMQHSGRWDLATEAMVEAARQVQAGGADFVLLCTNTMHKLADEVQQAISIPLVHVADATGQAILAKGFRRAGLLGTRFTMEEDFYRERLQERFGLEVLIPEEDERKDIHRVIYSELVLGNIREDSRRRYLEIIQGLVARGAECIILGCTEIGLLVKQEDTEIPLFDTTRIHALAAIEKALE